MEKERGGSYVMEWRTFQNLDFPQTRLVWSFKQKNYFFFIPCSTDSSNQVGTGDNGLFMCDVIKKLWFFLFIAQQKCRKLRFFCFKSTKSRNIQYMKKAILARYTLRVFAWVFRYWGHFKYLLWLLIFHKVSIVNVWNQDVPISDSAKIGTLKCPNLRNKVAWFMFEIGTAQLSEIGTN